MFLNVEYKVSNFSIVKKENSKTSYIHYKIYNIIIFLWCKKKKNQNLVNNYFYSAFDHKRSTILEFN